MMTRKLKLAAFGIACVVISVLVLTNPSEDRHLDAFVRKAQAWQSAHIQTCEFCDSVTNADDLRQMAISRFHHGAIFYGDGLRRKNYFLFSVLTQKGISDARTFGCCGKFFGPIFTSPFPCPQQISIVLPDARADSEFDSTFRFSLLADGSLARNGESITRTELEAQLDAIADKEATAITMEVEASTRNTETTKIIELLSLHGFDSIRMTVTRNSED